MNDKEALNARYGKFGKPEAKKQYHFTFVIRDNMGRQLLGICTDSLSELIDLHGQGDLWEVATFDGYSLKVARYEVKPQKETLWTRVKRLIRGTRATSQS